MAGQAGSGGRAVGGELGVGVSGVSDRWVVGLCHVIRFEVRPQACVPSCKGS